MTIRTRLTLSLALLGIVMTLVAGAGLYGLNAAAEQTRSIVIERVTPLRSLKMVADAYAIKVVNTINRVAAGTLSWQFGQSNMMSAKAVITRQWQTYMALPKSGEEQDLANTASAAMDKAAPALDKVKDIMTSGDNAAMTAFADKELYPAIDPISTAISSLIDLEVKAAQAQYEMAESNRMLLLMIMGGVGLGALLILGFAFTIVIRGVSMPLSGLQNVITRIAAGDLDAEVPHRKNKDEIGKIAAAIDVFKENARAIVDSDRATSARADLERERSAAMATLVDGLTGVVNAAVEGDFSQRIDTSFTSPELASVATGVNNLVATVERGVGDAGAVLSALARTDLTQRMQGDHKGVFDRLRTDINRVSDTLAAIVGRLREASGGVRVATGEILSGANDLAERTSKQAAAIEETSAATEQLAKAVVDNATRTDEASARARSVAEAAAGTGDVVRKATGAMERISSSSSKISNIIGMIDDIAFQTNLLALNASVEAARAGDAGKGFAVVAVEVRRLAQSAAKASSDVKVLIEQSARDVTDGTRLVSDASDRLLAMLDGVRENSEQLLAIAKASRGQSGAIGEITAAIRHMDEMTQHNAALVEETNAAIEQTESRAGDLDAIVETFVVEAENDETDSSPSDLAA